jgi:hypothetical protein
MGKNKVASSERDSEHRHGAGPDEPPEPARREFMRAGGMLAVGLALGTDGSAPAQNAQTAHTAQQASQDRRAGADEIPRRPVGRTGLDVSILGVGGHHLGDLPTVDDAVRLVHEAVDAGITFFDNCWEYYNGMTETWLGWALKGRKDTVVLMTKVCTHGRDKKAAMQQLEESLKRLRTDRVDVWQIHEVIYENDPDLHFATGGVIEALDQGKEGRQGPVRRLHGAQEPGDPLEDAGARLSVRHGSTAAQLLRCDLSQLRAAGTAGARAAGHRSSGYEEPGRRRATDPSRCRERG